MTHIYDDYGRRMAVTAIHAGPCTVTRLRDPKSDGYNAVQMGFEPMKASRAPKPQLGQLKQAGVGPFRYSREFRLRPVSDTGELTVGQQLTVDLFKLYELVDVTGISIGKGFQGGMKRWHWKGGRQTHGSMQHRQPGSIGSTTTPGRVWRGHHLPGHMGSDRVTVQNLRIVKLDPEQHLVLVQGAVPGSEGGLVLIRKSHKKAGVVRKPVELTLIIEEDETLSKTAKAASKQLKKKPDAA